MNISNINIMIYTLYLYETVKQAGSEIMYLRYVGLMVLRG